MTEDDARRHIGALTDRLTDVCFDYDDGFIVINALGNVLATVLGGMSVEDRRNFGEELETSFSRVLRLADMLAKENEGHAYN
jgi:hypothetical protein